MASLHHLLFTNLADARSGQPQMLRLTPNWTADARAALERWLQELQLEAGHGSGLAQRAFDVAGARQTVLALVLGAFGSDEAGRGGIWLSHALILAADAAYGDFGSALLRQARRFEAAARDAVAGADGAARLDAYVRLCRLTTTLDLAGLDTAAWLALDPEFVARAWSLAEAGAVDVAALAATSADPARRAEDLCVALSPLPLPLRLAATWSVGVQALAAPRMLTSRTTVARACAARVRAYLEQAAHERIVSLADQRALTDWPSWERALATGERQSSEELPLRAAKHTKTPPSPSTSRGERQELATDISEQTPLADLDADRRALFEMSRAYVDKRLEHLSAGGLPTGPAPRPSRWLMGLVALLVTMQIALLAWQLLASRELNRLRLASATSPEPIATGTPAARERGGVGGTTPDAPGVDGATPAPQLASPSPADTRRADAGALVAALATQPPHALWRRFVEQHPQPTADWLRAIAAAHGLPPAPGARRGAGRVAAASVTVARTCAAEIEAGTVPDDTRLEACAAVMFEYAHARQHLQATVDGDLARVSTEQVSALLGRLGIQRLLRDALGELRASNARDTSVQVAVAAHWIAQHDPPKDLK